MTTSYKVRPGQFDFNAYRSTPGGAITLTPELEAKLSAADAGIEAETARKIQNQRRMENIFRTVSMAIPAAGMGIASAAASSAAPAVVAAKTGGGMTFGNLFKLAEVGVPAITGLFGQRSQNRALDRQQQMEQANYAQQIAMARENETYRRSESERVAAEEARRWQAEEAFRQKQWEAQERDRVDLEARREPRRQASQRALLRLQDLLRLGRG